MRKGTEGKAGVANDFMALAEEETPAGVKALSVRASGYYYDGRPASFQHKVMAMVRGLCHCEEERRSKRSSA